MHPGFATRTLIAAVAATAVAVTALLAAASGRRPAPDPVVDRLVEQLRHDIVDAAPRQRDNALHALRRLRDPRLRPLFTQFASGDSASLRVHGIMGLAELDPGAPLDTLLIKRIPDAQEQAAIIDQSLQAGSLSDDQLRDIARWPDLEEPLRVLILGRIRRTGGAVSPAEFVPHLDGAGTAATYAALNLMAMDNPGVEPERLRAPIDALFALDRSRRRVLLGMMTQFIRAERIEAARPVVARVVEEFAGDGLLHFEALWTLLVISPADAATMTTWRNEWKRASGLGDRLRLALAVLDAAAAVGPRLSPEMPNLMRQDSEPLIALMGEAALAVVSGEDVRGPIADLVSQGHQPTVGWAVSYARQLKKTRPEEADTIWLVLIDVAARKAAGLPPLYEAALAASSELADARPELLREPIDAAVGARDTTLLQWMLTGVLRSPNKQCAALAERDDWPDPLTAALAVLIRARHAETLQPEQFNTLAELALESPVLPGVFKTQAAWLALRSKDLDRVALTRILREAAK